MLPEMSAAPDEKITPIEVADLCALLDATRERHGFTSDEKLAEYLGVSGQAIYRWRRNQIDLSARIVAALILEHTGSELSTAA